MVTCGSERVKARNGKGGNRNGESLNGESLKAGIFRVQNNSRLPAAAGTFSTLGSDFFYPRTKILKNYNRPTEVKVTVRSG